jgi:propionate CoA-transferase
LTLWGSSGFGGWTEEGFGDRYAKAGAVRCVLASHYPSMPAIGRMAREGALEAYCMPLGVMSHAVRAAASGQKWLLSTLGLNLYVDPALEGPAVNARSTQEWVRRVEVEGEPYLRYRTPAFDVVLIKGTAVDANGNISFQDEYVTADALALCMAAKANGGRVIAQVDGVSHVFARPRSVIVPGVLVDGVVVRAPDARDESRSILTGDVHVPGTHMDYWMSRISLSGKRQGKPADPAQQRIGERAAQVLRPGDVINVGIGIPEAVGPAAVERGILRDIVMTVESGAIGGLPAPGVSFGASIGADFVCDMAQQFDFYDGGGLNVCFMGALEVDRAGNVNVHSLPDRFVGIGGFANITHATQRVVFCTTLTTGGLAAVREGDRLVIQKEGSVRKFVPQVHSISFSAQNALARGQEVLYVTERCVFRLARGGLTLAEVFPGVDPQRDIFGPLGFQTPISAV